MDAFRIVFHIVTSKGAVHVLYGSPQTEVKTLTEAIAEGSDLLKSLSRTVLVIDDYGRENRGLHRTMCFNQYNIDSLEVTLERW